MREIHNIYVENSSINLTKQMYKDGSIKQMIRNFIKEDYPSFLGDVKYRVYDEFDYSKKQTISVGPEFYCEYKFPDFCATYYFTDYSFMVYIHHKGEHGTRIKDYSDEWVNYLTKHLSRMEREEYLKGLKGFVAKISKIFENQFLSAITEENQLDI